MNFEFMTIDTPLPPCMPFPRALTGFPVSSTAKVMYCRMLDAMRRHLRGFSRRNGGSGQSAQRDFFPCSLYRYPLFLPVQIRRTGKIHFQCTLTQHTRESPAERRFFLGVCTCTQRLIQSQNKSRFQSDKAANPLFFSGTSYGTAAFLFAQRQRRDEPCGNGNDCRHASLLLGCHV